MSGGDALYQSYKNYPAGKTASTEAINSTAAAISKLTDTAVTSA